MYVYVCSQCQHWTWSAVRWRRVWRSMQHSCRSHTSQAVSCVASCVTRRWRTTCWRVKWTRHDERCWNCSDRWCRRVRRRRVTGHSASSAGRVVAVAVSLPSDSDCTLHSCPQHYIWTLSTPLFLRCRLDRQNTGLTLFWNSWKGQRIQKWSGKCWGMWKIPVKFKSKWGNFTNLGIHGKFLQPNHFNVLVILFLSPGWTFVGNLNVLRIAAVKWLAGVSSLKWLIVCRVTGMLNLL